MHFKTQEERQNAAQSEINTLQAAVAVFPAVRNVLQSFDGKVFNKRLQTALQEATSQSIYCEHRYNIIDIYIIVNIGSYNRRTLAILNIEDMKDGKRINAEKAIASAAEYRSKHLKEAAHIQEVLPTIETRYKEIEYIEKLITGITADLTSTEKQMFDLWLRFTNR